MFLENMKSEELSVNGEWPDLKTKIIEKLIAQEYWYKGKLNEAANVIWLKISGKWFRLYFDYGIVFWRESNEEPHYVKPEANEDYDYPLNDLTEKYNLSGKAIESCEGSVISGGSQVVFKIENGKTIKFKNINDATSIET
ncbi:MAG: hypothetical protein CTY29_06665 [Methylobacter sp.]|nr:MAG: hypothetical protein CTY29_06665 [Methylobacter sp.]